jgi:hypothetical protein
LTFPTFLIAFSWQLRCSRMHFWPFERMFRTEWHFGPICHNFLRSYLATIDYCGWFHVLAALCYAYWHLLWLCQKTYFHLCWVLLGYSHVLAVEY